MRSLFSLLVISGFLFVTGCQSDVAATRNTSLPLSTSQPPEYNEGIDMSDPSIIPDAQAEKMIQLAKERLAKKFKLSEDQIFLSSAEPMTWTDTSLGCPQPGILYAQVTTPGYNILLEAMGQTFSYHTDVIDRVILCDIRPPNEIFLPP